jgi:hypothetical protein
MMTLCLDTGPRLRLLEWRPLSRNSLSGFATVELLNGLTISNISVHLSHGKTWASLPTRPQINSDGTARRGEDGRVIYNPVLKWPDRALQDGFSGAVVQALGAAYRPIK